MVDVPDMTGQKMAVGARYRLVLSNFFTPKNYAVLRCQIKNLPWATRGKGGAGEGRVCFAGHSQKYLS